MLFLLHAIIPCFVAWMIWQNITSEGCRDGSAKSVETRKHPVFAARAPPPPTSGA